MRHLGERGQSGRDGSALTHFTFSPIRADSCAGQGFALVFMFRPTRRRQLICRTSNEQRAAVMGSRSTTLCPAGWTRTMHLHHGRRAGTWENVFVHATSRSHNFFPRTGFVPRACCRAARGWE